MKLSISILNYNTRDLLESSLHSIYENTHDLDFEVIVCDNASGDGSADMVREKYPQVRLIANRENRYFTRGNNQMFEIAQGEYIFIMAGDVALEGAVMRDLVQYLETHPQVGAVTPQLRVGTTCSRYSPWIFSALDRTFLHLLLPGLYHHLRHHFWIAGWDRNVEQEVEVASDSALMIRKSVLDGMGGYDERLILYYTEEDLCRTIWTRTNYRIVYAPIPAVLHLEHQSVRQVDPRKIRRIWWRDMKYYHRKWDGFIPWLILTIIGWINTPVYQVGYLLTRRARTRLPEVTFQQQNHSDQTHSHQANGS